MNYNFRWYWRALPVSVTHWISLPFICATCTEFISLCCLLFSSPQIGHLETRVESLHIYLSLCYGQAHILHLWRVGCFNGIFCTLLNRKNVISHPHELFLKRPINCCSWVLGSTCSSQKCAWKPQRCLDNGPECVERRGQESTDQKWMTRIRLSLGVDPIWPEEGGTAPMLTTSGSHFHL